MKRTVILILVLVASIVGLLILSLSPKKEASTIVAPVPVAQTTLSLTTPKATSSAMTTDVVINTRGNKVTAVQLELSYNPADITIIDATAGAFFKTPDELLKKVDSVNGRISYALGVGLGQKGISGQGIVATISFNRLKITGTTAINFTSKSLVSAEGIAQSVLKSTMGTKFDLSTAQSTPSAR